jgi:hypothetical protein
MSESPPFQNPIEFKRNQVRLKLTPFAMNQVRLTGSVYQQAQEWNAGYLQRLPEDRLIHNFTLECRPAVNRRAFRWLGKTELRAAGTLHGALPVGRGPPLRFDRRQSYQSQGTGLKCTGLKCSR